MKTKKKQSLDIEKQNNFITVLNINLLLKLKMKNNIDREKRIRLMDQIRYENRKSYFELFDQYLRSKMGAEEVVDNFFPLYYSHRYKSERLSSDPSDLETIQIVSKSEGLCRLMDCFFDDCEAFDVEETDDNSSYPLSENSFRKLISINFQKLEEYE